MGSSRPLAASFTVLQTLRETGRNVHRQFSFCGSLQRSPSGPSVCEHLRKGHRPAEEGNALWEFGYVEMGKAQH